MEPGEIFYSEKPIILNEGRKTKTLKAKNKGDRPIQVGSHYHFYEVNSSLEFERDEAFGYRLNTPAGTAVRFEPQDEKEVELVAMGGDRVIYGMNNKTNGSLD